MITTFTSTPHLTEKKQQNEGTQSPAAEFPSDATLNFILNYSKNLDVKKSVFVSEIEIMKS